MMMCTAGTEHMEVREFQEWPAAARPGERIAYTKGELAASIHAAWQADHPDRQKLSALQEAQRRLKPGAFEYLAEWATS
jgi:hypothetical protein